MEKVLRITESKARELYRTASDELKAILENTFGPASFSQKITDRIKTYEDACREIGITPIDVDEMHEEGIPDDEIAYRKIKTITKALNQGWCPNWNDGNQKKWVPYFNTLSTSGFAFGGTNYDYSAPDAGNASRLCFQSDELASYAGTQFTDLYKSFIL